MVPDKFLYLHMADSVQACLKIQTTHGEEKCGFFHELIDHCHGFAVSVDIVALEFDDVVEDFWKFAENSFACSSNVRRESDNVAIHENVKR